ncbi:hypothetical protein TRV_06819 [Trichophyton verrucosum HKI 0517]|uniref:Uncharacterized protein n=1 Tax=Trichophyton verrucosum (strain HKI 0517) TaxID=663202 RepID=D4DI12_TRIVH|nr:uncharacterized protein TRV_06819 [Trichophyton verrucosum HKI 0517]EFE38490.1 hypothetical protein TRV_06819 [Trichophyton verrucosum HKI 0517]
MQPHPQLHLQLASLPFAFTLLSVCWSSFIPAPEMADGFHSRRGILLAPPSTRIAPGNRTLRAPAARDAIVPTGALSISTLRWLGLDYYHRVGGGDRAVASASSSIVVSAGRLAVDRFCCAVFQEPVVAQFIQGRLEVVENNGIAETFADEGYLFDSDDWLAQWIETRWQSTSKHTEHAQYIDDDENDRNAHRYQHDPEPRAMTNELDEAKVVLGLDYPEDVAGRVYPPGVTVVALSAITNLSAASISTSSILPEERLPRPCLQEEHVNIVEESEVCIDLDDPIDLGQNDGADIEHRDPVGKKRFILHPGNHIMQTPRHVQPDCRD